MSVKKEIPYIDFYTKHGISPVSQNISDIDAHFERRTSLFKDLGVPPLYFRGSNVMEVGPGSGYNSIHIAQMNTKKFTLIEPNKTGRLSIEKLFSELAPQKFQYEIINSLVQDVSYFEEYDLVFGEGFLGMLPDAEAVIKKMGSFVRKGGVLSFTCSDSVSYLADILKRVIGSILIDRSASIGEQLDIVRPYYNDLLTIDGMSRPIDDWIIDNVLQPMSKNYTFTIEQAIQSLDSEFVFYNSSSPRFNGEWRWYKQQCNQGSAYNELALKGYKENIHNLLDYRFNHPPMSEERNSHLLKLSQQVFDCLCEYESKGQQESVIQLLDVIYKIIDHSVLMKLHNKTIESLTDYVHGLKMLINRDKNITFKSFSQFSGRGQQFVSFLKKDPPYIR